MAKSLKLCAEINPLPKTLTHTEPEVLLDSEERVGETAELLADMVVRGLIVFEYRAQVESQHMAKEAAPICRLQRRLVCWCGQGVQGQDSEWYRCPGSHSLPERLWAKHIPLCLAKTQFSRFWGPWFHLWLAKQKKTRQENDRSVMAVRVLDTEASYPLFAMTRGQCPFPKHLNDELQMFSGNASSC